MSSKVYKFHVEMTCTGCSSAAARVLGKLGDKVSDIDINLDQKTVTVASSELTSADLLETLKKTGKEVKLME